MTTIPTEPIGSIPRPLDLIEAVASSGGPVPLPTSRRQLSGRGQALRAPAGEAGRHLAIGAQVTAFGRPEDRKHVLAAGFDGYLKKPLDPEELVTPVLRLRNAQG